MATAAVAAVAAVTKVGGGEHEQAAVRVQVALLCRFKGSGMA